ncbi:HAD ATPase, P-type, family IC [Edhazardia aedis USNM 41457]|uniref:HAD ATPase, P-type, family IC n=1 Tax=Edhazardia aedis (strain USNM 41457) TaxID=1003232 RepID=J9D3I7_EDHAE|nr:HAD ATPase, P-type, family IC [Edhazardia aedis USNM 41457]|eukprot:EJW02406.1 HAD ATPase, P-type, family IC [Edhazardia aedis USNM 41457]
MAIQEEIIRISNLKCNACQPKLHDLFRSYKGIIDIKTNIFLCMMQITFDNNIIKLSTIERVLEKNGFLEDTRKIRNFYLYVLGFVFLLLHLQQIFDIDKTSKVFTFVVCLFLQYKFFKIAYQKDKDLGYFSFLGAVLAYIVSILVVFVDFEKGYTFLCMSNMISLFLCGSKLLEDVVRNQNMKILNSKKNDLFYSLDDFLKIQIDTVVITDNNIHQNFDFSENKGIENIVNEKNNKIEHNVSDEISIYSAKSSNENFLSKIINTSQNKCFQINETIKGFNVIEKKEIEDINDKNNHVNIKNNINNHPLNHLKKYLSVNNEMSGYSDVSNDNILSNNGVIAVQNENLITKNEKYFEELFLKDIEIKKKVFPNNKIQQLNKLLFFVNTNSNFVYEEDTDKKLKRHDLKINQIGIDQIQVNDILIIEKGQIIPADGILIDFFKILQVNDADVMQKNCNQNQNKFLKSSVSKISIKNSKITDFLANYSDFTYVDESNITGESIPKYKKNGDQLFAGTTNKSQKTIMKILKIRNDTLQGQILTAMQKANFKDDNFSTQKFASYILSYALRIMFLYYCKILSKISSFHDLLNHDKNLLQDLLFPIKTFISIILVACPCALNICEPLIYLIASNILCKKGIILGNCKKLPCKIDCVILDKTGTITDNLIVENIVINQIDLLHDLMVELLFNICNCIKSTENQTKIVCEDLIASNLVSKDQVSQKFTSKSFDIFYEIFVLYVLCEIEKNYDHPVAETIRDFCKKRIENLIDDFVSHKFQEYEKTDIFDYSKMSRELIIGETINDEIVTNERIEDTNNDIFDKTSDYNEKNFISDRKNIENVKNGKFIAQNDFNKINQPENEFKKHEKLLTLCQKKIKNAIIDTLNDFLKISVVEKIENFIFICGLINLNNEKYAYHIKKESKKYNFMLNYEKIATFEITEQIKENVFDVITQLTKENIQVIILSGDTPDSVAEIANKLGVANFYSNKHSTQKWEVIRKHMRQFDKVCMVGDGINDIMSLRESNFGVGLGILDNKISVTILKKDISTLPFLLKFCKKINSRIKICYKFACIFNGIGICIASGFLSWCGIELEPENACGSMFLSSCLIITICLSLYIC